MKVQFKGKVTKIMPAKQFKTGSSSREFWAEEEIEPSADGREFKNVLPFEIFSSGKAKQDFTAVLDEIPRGATVSFEFSPRGNEWKDRLFVSLRVVSKIEVLSKPSAKGVPPPAQPSYEEPDPDSGDMPF